MNRWQRGLAAAGWLVPAAVLAAAGLAKLIAPAGTAPRVLAFLTDLAPYPLWLRALGLGELALALCIARPRSRRPSLLAAAGLLGAFALLIAASAADLAFVGDCGCFAGLGTSSRYYGWLVLRNAALVGVAVLGARVGRPRAAMLALLALVLAVSVPGLVGELQLRRAAYGQLDAMARGARTQGYQGQPLPELALTDADGRALDSGQAFRPGDVVAFVARACPHCLALGPALAALDDSLRGVGRRVVLVLVNEGTVDPDWRRLLAWEDRAALATLDREALVGLGVTAVPLLVQLGPDREVQFNEAYPLPTAIWKSLPLIEARAPGTTRAVWHAVVAGIFGPDADLADTLRLQDGVATAPVIAGSGRRLGRLCVVQDGWREADLIEVAVGLDGDGRLAGVVPLSAGAYVRVFAPRLGLVDSLRGLAPAAADSLLARRGRDHDLRAPAWRSLRRALQRLGPLTRSEDPAAGPATAPATPR
ncbi:MAG: hypothetical protein R3D98_01445 [Candidatus Krumholzibacteriia bacterium]